MNKIIFNFIIDNSIIFLFIIIVIIIKFLKNLDDEILFESTAISIIGDILESNGFKDNKYIFNKMLYAYRYSKCNTYRKLKRRFYRIVITSIIFKKIINEDGKR